MSSSMRILTSALCTFIAAAAFALPASAAEDVYSAALAHAGRTESDKKRDKAEPTAELLKLAGIKPGMRVIDFLAADGYYTEILSYVVGPKGQVVMLNNAEFDKYSEPAWQQRIANNRLPNVEHRTVDLNQMKLGENTYDAVVMSKVYHDLYWTDPSWPKIQVRSTLDQIAKALKPGGVVLLIDHSAKPGTGSSAATPLHRIDEAFAKKDFEASGFEVVSQSNALRKPEDKRDQVSYKPPALGNTDRFVMVLKKKA
jgi:predicted methyltransferase